MTTTRTAPTKRHGWWVAYLQIKCMHILEVECYFCGAKMPCAYVCAPPWFFMCAERKHSFVTKEKNDFFCSRVDTIYLYSLPSFSWWLSLSHLGASVWASKAHCSTPHFSDCAAGYFLFWCCLFCPFCAMPHLLCILSLLEIFSKQKCKCYKLYAERKSPTLKCVVNLLCNAQII